MSDYNNSFFIIISYIQYFFYKIIDQLNKENEESVEKYFSNNLTITNNELNNEFNNEN